MELRRKRFDRPDEVRKAEKARIELVELGELAVGRTVFEPGWRWSEHVKPIAGTESCQVHHLGYVVSGHLHVEMTGGASLEVVGGDAFEVPPGHDAWVIGDEPWVSIDWAGRRLFAKSPQEISDRIFTTVVFTDLSGSTETLNRLGDAKWRLLLADHDEAVRARDRAVRWTRGEDHRRRLPRAVRQPSTGGARCGGHDRRRHYLWPHRPRRGTGR